MMYNTFLFEFLHRLRAGGGAIFFFFLIKFTPNVQYRHTLIY